MFPEGFETWDQEERQRWLIENGLMSEGYDPLSLKFGWSKEKIDAYLKQQHEQAAMYKAQQQLAQSRGGSSAIAEKRGGAGVISGPGGMNPNPYKPATPNIPGTISGPGGQNPYSQPFRNAAAGGGFSPMSGMSTTTYNPYMNNQRRRMMSGYSGGGFASGLSGGGMGSGMSGAPRSY